MAVGFEFATGWDIYKLKNGVQPPQKGTKIDDRWITTNTTNYPKAAVVKGGLGWAMTVDGTEIEYVVNQVEESEGGANTLVQSVGDLTRFVGKMNMLNAQSFITLADFPKGTFPPKVDPFIIHIKKDLLLKQIEAIPQVTGGIRLARVRKLWRLLADPSSEAAKVMFGGEPGGATGYASLLKPVIIEHSKMADPNWKTHTPSAKMRGLVTMIMTYLRRGYSPRQDGVGAVKYLFLLMSRTSFGALFADLPQDEQTHYKNGAGRDQWVEYICKHMMKQVAGIPPNGVDPAGLVVERKINDRKNLSSEDSVSLPVTRKAWLLGMLDGRDLLSADEHPLGGEDNALWEDSNPELGHRLRGLAGLGDKMDNVVYQGRNNKGAIIEFRARQATLSYTLWLDYAEAMHRFITGINEGERHGVLDLEKLD